MPPELRKQVGASMFMLSDCLCASLHACGKWTHGTKHDSGHLAAKGCLQVRTSRLVVACVETDIHRSCGPDHSGILTADGRFQIELFGSCPYLCAGSHARGQCWRFHVHAWPLVALKLVCPWKAVPWHQACLKKRGPVELKPKCVLVACITRSRDEILLRHFGMQACSTGLNTPSAYVF